MLRAQGAFMDPSVIKENTVQGIAASQGIAYGQVFVYIQSDVEVPSYQVEPEHRIEEVARFDKALLVTRQQIAKIQDEVEKNLGTEEALIFEIGRTGTTGVGYGGTTNGLLLAEGNDEPKDFCESAKELKADTEIPNVWE